MSNGLDTPAAAAVHGQSSASGVGSGAAAGTLAPAPNSNKVFESESESSCGEESRRRTAEAFMSGIQSAIQEKAEGAAADVQGGALQRVLQPAQKGTGILQFL